MQFQHNMQLLRPDEPLHPDRTCRAASSAIRWPAQRWVASLRNTLQEAVSNICFRFIVLAECEQIGKSHSNEASQPKPNQSASLATRHAHSDTSSEIVTSARIWEKELQDGSKKCSSPYTCDFVCARRTNVEPCVLAMGSGTQTKRSMVASAWRDPKPRAV